MSPRTSIASVAGAPSSGDDCNSVVMAGAPAFDPANLTAASQEKQFGYNCDFIGLHALPAGSRAGDRYLMVVNHEYTNPGLMFAGLGSGRAVNLR
mgnify:CR=1 FL=1